MGIKLGTVTCLELSLEFSLWLPFDIPETLTDEKLGWAEQTACLEAETIFEGDNQRLAALSDSPEEG